MKNLNQTLPVQLFSNTHWVSISDIYGYPKYSYDTHYLLKHFCIVLKHCFISAPHFTSSHFTLNIFGMFCKTSF